MLNKILLAVVSVIWVSIPCYAGSDSDGGGEPIYRVDCRFHNEEKYKNDEKNKGSDLGFCYASAIYRLEKGEFDDVFLAVGCGRRTIFNDHARVHKEMTLDRIQPHRAATPAIEIFPQGQLVTEGTYTSILDIAEGRFQGLCYVHKVKYDNSYDHPRK